MGNNCTFVSASLAFSAPYTFTSGITVLLTNGVTVFINLAGQSLSEAQIANVLNATPALNTLGIWFSSSAPSPPIVVNTYSQSSEIYVSRIIFDATVGT
ncbi:MAG TPA: hypothetical protein DCQ93_01525, partial [Bacteroidetes bacterium]|nr:hypothetical protein [Bacteroidota bacterium]